MQRRARADASSYCLQQPKRVVEKGGVQDVGSSGAVRFGGCCSDENAVAVGLKRVSSAFLLGNGLGRFRKALVEEGMWVTCKQMRCCIMLYQELCR
jgi:hypothetical protein